MRSCLVFLIFGDLTCVVDYERKSKLLDDDDMDAYEHEVRNDCSADRVIFQMVLAGEGLWAVIQ